jgi:hypothetical protein
MKIKHSKRNYRYICTYGTAVCNFFSLSHVAILMRKQDTKDHFQNLLIKLPLLTKKEGSSIHAAGFNFLENFSSFMTNKKKSSI